MKTDYALVALSHLAAHPDETTSARSISDECGVPLPILTNILKALSRAGCVSSERGANGGYRLARSSASINVDEVITAIEGPVQFVRCLPAERNGRAKPCELEPSCQIRLPIHRINEHLRKFLQGVPLSDLVAEEPIQIGGGSAPCR